MSDLPESSAMPTPLPPSAVRLVCDPSTPAGEALTTVFSELGGRALLHRGRVLDSPDPDALHDFRVAIRRSRSALADVRGVVVGAQRARLRRGLERLGRLTSPLRDLDVLAEAIARDPEGRPGRAAVLDAIANRAGDERARVLKGLEPAAVEAWLQGSQRLTPPSGRFATESIGDVAERAIRRAWRRFHAAGERAAASGQDAEIHRLRIRGKRLRYALEFFGLLGELHASLPDLQTLRNFQDVLGAHNDLFTQIPILESLRTERVSGAARHFLDTALEARRRRLAASRRGIVDGWRTAGIAGASGA